MKIFLTILMTLSSLTSFAGDLLTTQEPAEYLAEMIEACDDAKDLQSLLAELKKTEKFYREVLGYGDVGCTTFETVTEPRVRISECSVVNGDDELTLKSATRYIRVLNGACVINQRNGQDLGAAEEIPAPVAEEALPAPRTEEVLPAPRRDVEPFSNENLDGLSFSKQWSESYDIYNDVGVATCTATTKLHANTFEFSVDRTGIDSTGTGIYIMRDDFAKSLENISTTKDGHMALSIFDTRSGRKVILYFAKQSGEFLGGAIYQEYMRQITPPHHPEPKVVAAYSYVGGCRK